jgi:hypothetical protein
MSINRVIVNVATGRYRALQDRLANAVIHEPAYKRWWGYHLPPGSPTHEDVPYAFKIYAIKNMMEEGIPAIMWMDSSIVPQAPLNPLWELIERQGYWFSANPPWDCGQFTCDAALPALGISREEAFNIPHVMATAFGLDFRHDITREFYTEYMRLVNEKTAFRGAWNNRNKAASSDPRVLGHRHDQTVASVLAWRLGMTLTTPPEFIVDGGKPTDRTILEIHRL